MSLRLGLALLLVSLAVDAQAATYRCELDGRVTYGDVPCVFGKQTELAPPPAPDARSRIAAAARAKAGEAALRDAEHERLRAQRIDASKGERAQATSQKRRAVCARLALRAKRAAEDAAAGNGRDAGRAKTRARRAAEDEAACKART